MRPICQAKCAPNNILSWILAKVVGKVGEEALNRGNLGLNTYLKDEGREIGVGSRDVVGLYPSLQKDWVRRIMMMKTEVKVAGTDCIIIIIIFVIINCNVVSKK